jgi:ribosomal protein S18 acetylase RimI-like enzyme
VNAALLDRIDAYCDAVARAAARAEELRSLVLFVAPPTAWPYYARPRRGSRDQTAEDVERVRRRQRELGVRETFEWIHEVSPQMREAAEQVGLVIAEHPLMVLDGRPRPPREPADDVEIGLVTADDDLATTGSIARLAFSHLGTSVGPVGAEELRTLAAERAHEPTERERERIRTGAVVTAVAVADGVTAAVGSHVPVGNTTEVVGVGTLPAFRRRGLGGAVTRFLAEDARRRGIETIWLSAGDDEIAGMYAALGFERVGTACAAEPVAR